MSAASHLAPGWLQTGWICLIAGCLISSPASESSPTPRTAAPNDVDSRIAFYRARLGGPATYPAYARLGLACLQKARDSGRADLHQEGLRHLEKSLAFQRNYDALLGLAIGLAEHHHFHESLPYAREAVEANATVEALGALFDIQLALGQSEEAETTQRRMFDSGPSFEAFARKSAWQEYHGNASGALQAMREALAATRPGMSPSTRAWAEVRAGSLYLSVGESDSARAAYERALEIAPGFYFAREHLAEWHAAHGHWREAGDLFEYLLRTRPEASYRIGLAEVHRQMGKTTDAEREIKAALTELQETVKAGGQDQLRPLALLLLESKDTARDGLLYAERDWKIRQDNLAADTLAWAYYQNDRPDKALRLSAEALRSGSADPRVLLHAGLIRCQQGRLAEGQLLLRRALQRQLAFGPAERRLAQAARSELNKESP